MHAHTCHICTLVVGTAAAILYRRENRSPSDEIMFPNRDARGADRQDLPVAGLLLHPADQPFPAAGRRGLCPDPTRLSAWGYLIISFGTARRFFFRTARCLSDWLQSKSPPRLRPPSTRSTASPAPPTSSSSSARSPPTPPRGGWPTTRPSRSRGVESGKLCSATAFRYRYWLSITC